MTRVCIYGFFLSALIVSVMNAQAEKQINVYFQNDEKEAAAQARGDSSAYPVQVFPVQRMIRSNGPEREALRLLLLGPSPVEQDHGFSSNCSGLQLKKFKIFRGSAVVSLKGKLHLRGLLSGPRLRLQIEKTLTQFRTIKWVTISINDKQTFDDLR
jgi:spore germination protein GerM